MSSKAVAQLSIQRPISPTPCEVSVAGQLLLERKSSKSSGPIERLAASKERPGRTQWRRRGTAIIERCDRSAQNTRFTPSSMHFWRMNTSMSAMIVHDRSASSMVAQSTAMSSVFRHRRACAMPQAHVGPRCRAWCSTAPSQPSFIACAPSRPKCHKSAASVTSCSSRRKAVVAPQWPPFFAWQQGRPAPVPSLPRGNRAVL